MELKQKQHDVASLFEGEVMDESDRVAVSVKGYVEGFRAQLRAFAVDWPFDVSYIIETTDVPEEHEQSKIVVVPRMGRGLWSFLSHIFLFESKGMSVNDKRLEKKLVFSYDYRDTALRLIKYPGVPDILAVLEEDCHMKELVIKTDTGICFTQGTNFKSLDLDLCQATFNYLGQLAKVMNELF